MPSDGRLRLRVRSYDREAAWAPRYVSNELAGTHQAASTHRRTAVLRAAEAENDPDRRAELEQAAADAAALADILDTRAAQLQLLDDARSRWLAHTAGSRAAAERAKAELAARHADDAEPEQRVTAEEWLEAHRAATLDDDRHREITDADLVDNVETSRDLDRDVPDADTSNRIPEAYGLDIREVAAAEPAPADEDVVRVPTAD